MKNLRSFLLRSSAVCALFALSTGVTALRAADDATAIIQRAREFLGGDAALDAVLSLRFKGHVTSADGKTHAIEIFARKPMQQLIIEESDDVRVLTGLDDYDGWRKEGPVSRPDSGRIILMAAPEIRRLRASTWQVVYYYKDVAAVGGSITLDGEEEIDGIACARVVFAHPGGVRFVRFFDKATGRLVLTRTDDGAELRESGEIIVAGVHFPKELTTTAADQTTRVVFDEIAVNETYDDARFKTPMPKVNFGPSPAPAAEAAPPRAEPPGTTSSEPTTPPTP